MKAQYTIKRKEDSDLRWFDLLDETDLVDELEEEIKDLDGPIELSYDESSDSLILSIYTKTNECLDVVRKWATENESYIHKYAIIER